MFVSQLCGARSVQCVCVDVKMIVQVFVSSVVAVMVGELSTANGMLFSMLMVVNVAGGAD